MIIYLYGPDSYRINQKIQEIIKGYETKNPSGLNLVKMDFTEIRLVDFFEAIKSSSFIPEKKLIISKNLSENNSEEVLEFLKSQNIGKRENIILVMVSFKDSKKDKLFEYLTKKPNQSQNFNILREYEVKNWIKKSAGSLEIDFTGEAIDFLVSNYSLDLWRLDCEIKKLADYKIKGVISKAQVEELLIPSADYKKFELTDALARKDKKKALEALYRSLDNEEKPAELLGLLAWQVRNLLKFKSNPEKPLDLKLHPFVLGKVRESAKLFSVEELGGLMTKIINLDLALKTTTLDPKIALSSLIAEL